MKILKNSIPYITDVNIAGENYQFEFTCNQYDGRVYVNLYTPASDLIYPNEPIIYGVPLWINKMTDTKGNLNKKFPKKYIIPNTVDRKPIDIRFSNIDKIQLLMEG